MWDAFFSTATTTKPLAAVSAMDDAGSTVVFSRRWGSYVENDGSKEGMNMERVGDTFEMVLQTNKREEGANRAVKRAGDGGKKFGDMETDANDEENGDE